MLDVDRGIYCENETVNADTLGAPIGGASWEVATRRLRGGLSDGVDVVTLDNGRLQLQVLPTRGMGIWKGRIGDLDLQWNSPVQRPVHPRHVDEMRRGGIGWLDGFNELVCRCGLGWHGAPGNDVQHDDDGNVTAEQFLPLHGRIANLPAHHVSVELRADGAICLTGVIDEASVFGGHLRLTSTLTTYPNSEHFEIEDTVTNCGSGPAETEMLYHCNFGRPLLDAGSTLQTACSALAPRDDRAAEDIDTWSTYAEAEAGYAEQVYFTKPVSGADGMGLAVLANEAQSAAVGLRFHTATLPWFVQWKNTQADADGYCTGLEPASSLPNPRPFERVQGRVRVLQAQESVTYQLRFSLAQSASGVAKLLREVEDLQARQPCSVSRSPRSDWSG